MNIIILGPPGSGKGTQAKKLSETFNLYYFESGGFVRELAKKNSRIKGILERGELVPEEEMTRYVSEYLGDKVPTMDNIVFDGYPRFINQYKFLKKWLENKGSKINKVFLLEVSDNEVIKRLSARRICERCTAVYNLVTNPPPGEMCQCMGRLIQRQDDKPQVIRERLEGFRRETLPMVEYIESEGLLQRINGERPIEVIFSDIRSVVTTSLNAN